MTVHYATEPDWSAATCVDLEPALFFESSSEAFEVCESCPIMEDCRRWAIATRQPVMVWGGLTPRSPDERQPACGTLKAFRRHVELGEPLDKYCRAARDGGHGSETFYVKHLRKRVPFERGDSCREAHMWAWHQYRLNRQYVSNGALSRSCPFCDARPGERCRTRGGELSKTVHNRRTSS